VDKDLEGISKRKPTNGTRTAAAATRKETAVPPRNDKSVAPQKDKSVAPRKEMGTVPALPR
jgi:hypothetical protein